MKRISLFARDSRDLREKRDGSEVSSSLVAPVAHVLPVALTIHTQEPRIRAWSRSVMNHAGESEGTRGAFLSRGGEKGRQLERSEKSRRVVS